MYQAMVAKLMLLESSDAEPSQIAGPDALLTMMFRTNCACALLVWKRPTESNNSGKSNLMCLLNFV